MTRSDLIAALALLPRADAIECLLLADDARREAAAALAAEAAAAVDDGRDDIAADLLAVVHLCADSFGVSPTHLMGRRRKDRVVRARMMAMRLSVTRLGLSTVEAGRYFSRSHTTIMHARDKAEHDASYEAHSARAAVASMMAGR